MGGKALRTAGSDKDSGSAAQKSASSPSGRASFRTGLWSMPNLTWLLALVVPAQFFLALLVCSSCASLQLDSFPNQLRGQVAALLVFTISLGGRSAWDHCCRAF